MMKYYIIILMIFLSSCKNNEKTSIPTPSIESIEYSTLLKHEVVEPVQVQVYTEESCKEFKQLCYSADTYIQDIVYDKKILVGFDQLILEKKEITQNYSWDEIGVYGGKTLTKGELIRMSRLIELVNLDLNIKKGSPEKALQNIQEIIKFVLISKNSNNFVDTRIVFAIDLPMLSHLVKSYAEKFPSSIEKLMATDEWSDLIKIQFSQGYSKYFNSITIHHGYVFNLIAEKQFITKENKLKNEITLDDFRWITEHEFQEVQDLRIMYLLYAQAICELNLLQIFLTTENFNHRNQRFPVKKELDQKLFTDSAGQTIQYKYLDTDKRPEIYYDAKNTDYGKILIKPGDTWLSSGWPISIPSTKWWHTAYPL